MSVILAPVAWQRFVDNNGNALAGGKLFTYTGGTSTKQATWTDSTQVTLNSNPIILDSRGECSIWIDPVLLYKFVLAPANDTDPPTSPIKSQDNMTATPYSQQQIGAVLWPRTTAEIAGGVTPSNYGYPPLNVLRYGADPTGSSPSDTAVSSAVAVLGAAGGMVYFPAGLYVFASQINLDQKFCIRFQGDAGQGPTGHHQGPILKYTGTGSANFI